MNDQQIEQEIQAKGLTAPRVTPADIEANIRQEIYFTAADAVRFGFLTADLRFVLERQRRNVIIESLPTRSYAGACSDIDAVAPVPPELSLLTFCVLILNNGFTVVGKSACASPENFDAELGRKIARQDAVQQIWPLMGYALKQELAAEARGDINHDIGWAVRQAKQGLKVTRRGWNAPGQWVAFSPGGEVPAEDFWAPANRSYALQNGGAASVFSGMTLKNAQGHIVMGWVPSTTDLLMQDWEVVL